MPDLSVLFAFFFFLLCRPLRFHLFLPRIASHLHASLWQGFIFVNVYRVPQPSTNQHYHIVFW